MRLTMIKQQAFSSNTNPLSKPKLSMIVSLPKSASKTKRHLTYDTNKTMITSSTSFFKTSYPFAQKSNHWTKKEIRCLTPKMISIKTSKRLKILIRSSIRRMNFSSITTWRWFNRVKRGILRNMYSIYCQSWSMKETMKILIYKKRILI